MNKQHELIEELKQIYNDKDFVCSTIDIAKSQKSINTILDYIKTSKELGDELTSDDIQLLAIHLRNEEDKKEREKAKRRIVAAVL